MSGGSYNYACFTIENEYVGKMYDPEMNKLMKDLSKVLHDLEWWQSDDIGEGDYRKTLKEFKQKWLRGNPIENLESIINEEVEKLREELWEMIGVEYSKGSD